jgi:hypothetical protein
MVCSCRQLPINPKSFTPSGNGLLATRISGSWPLASSTSGIWLGRARGPEVRNVILGMILHSKLAEDRGYRIHEVCALLTDALLCNLRRDDKGLHARHVFGLRPCPSRHHVAQGVFDSCETQGRRRHERDSVLSFVELQGTRKLRLYTLFIIKCGWIRIQN